MILKNDIGLSFEFNNTGSVRVIKAGNIRINLNETSEFQQSGTSLYLRKKGDLIRFVSLVGAGSDSKFTFSNNRFYSKGEWEGLEYLCELNLSENSLRWDWSVRVKNITNVPVEVDVILAQDIGLKSCLAGFVNEYYASQYIERLVLAHELHGKVVCCRQNLKEPCGNPWFMIGSTGGASSASVDGMQFYGSTHRDGRVPKGLLSENLGGNHAGESSLVAMQAKPQMLGPMQDCTSSFTASFLFDHPEATSSNDLKHLEALFSGVESIIEPHPDAVWYTPLVNLFTEHDLLQAEELDVDELKTLFGNEWRHVEKSSGKVLSFFKGDNHHVVLKAKELIVDRPHGNIMQALSSITPTDELVSTTSFAFGVFNSHLTQGNTNFNSLLSVCSNAFNLASPAGQRIFVGFNETFYLLGVPSAFEMGLNHCRWIYKHGSLLFEVVNWTSKDKPQVNLHLRVLKGGKLRLKISHHFDETNSWRFQPSENRDEFVIVPGNDSLLINKYPEARFRLFVQGSKKDYYVDNAMLQKDIDVSTNISPFVICTNATSEFTISILGEIPTVCEPRLFDNSLDQFKRDSHDARNFWSMLSGNIQFESESPDVKAIQEVLPWFGMNALTHYLTPYGLEQFGGAAWGTRDVSQGPIDFLINLGQYNAARRVICMVFSHQNPDGGWPQWWMFDRYFNIRAHEAHGDITYWVILALAQYIFATGDTTILDEGLPFYHEKGPDHSEVLPLRQHMDRLLTMIKDSFIKSTALVPFGGGDWNDSLQPVSDDLASRMISSWTVEMNYQAFMQYAQVLKSVDENEKSQELLDICARIKNDFNNYLVKDGVVAGYGLVEKDGSIGLLLHPSDEITGIHYSLLPMNRGVISGIFTQEQAILHGQLIEKHLKGPDGARLMNKPLKYKGGIQSIFQRAESSTFFGREIGLMYVHEHLRYAESLAMLGKAEEFVFALRQSFPVNYNQVVERGDFRQANCYYSSSDIAFKSRYEADELYHEINSGKTTFRGGWRVYSSGPGIFTGLIISRLLGIRLNHPNIVFDPVMPFSFNGLEVKMDFLENRVKFLFRITDNCFGPKNIIVNGKNLKCSRETNPNRTGGLSISKSSFIESLHHGENAVEIFM